MLFTLSAVTKLVATHLVKKAIGKAVDSRIPDSVKKASKIYSAVKTIRKVTR